MGQSRPNWPFRANVRPTPVGDRDCGHLQSAGKALIPGYARIRRTVFLVEAFHTIGPRFQF
jgi:hypothetical protein